MVTDRNVGILSLDQIRGCSQTSRHLEGEWGSKPKHLTESQERKGVKQNITTSYTIKDQEIKICRTLFSKFALHACKESFYIMDVILSFHILNYEWSK